MGNCAQVLIIAFCRTSQQTLRVLSISYLTVSSGTRALIYFQANLGLLSCLLCPSQLKVYAELCERSSRKKFQRPCVFFSPGCCTLIRELPPITLPWEGAYLLSKVRQCCSWRPRCVCSGIPKSVDCDDNRVLLKGLCCMLKCLPTDS